jgi:hypothetical protein
MFEDSLRLPKIGPDRVLVRERLPCVLVAMPVEMPPDFLRGMASKVQSATENIWQVIAPPNAPPATIAQLLGVLILDEQEHIMQPPLMPSKAPSVHVLSSGEMRQGRGKRLAPWVLSEINRLADVLLGQYRDYVAEVEDALRGGTKTFRPLPDDFIIRDQTGHCRLGPPPPSIEVDASGSERVRYGLQWYQIVGEDYRRNRYMGHLSDDQLARRIEDIVANSHTITPEGLISLDINAISLYWFAKLQEVIAEMTFRHGPYPAGWSSGFINPSRLPGSLSPEQLEKRQQLKPRTQLPTSFLIKYGKIQHIEAAYYKGQIRVSPASTYKDPSLNAAIRDDELIVKVDFDPTFSGIYESDQADELAGQNIRREMHKRMGTNYYVYCTSSELSTRLLLDFEAEAALIIRDPDAFLRRVNIAIRQQLPDWRPIVKEVKYYDPLQVTPMEVDVLTWKHFRYAYQKEVRLAWLPSKSIQILEPIFVELGSLSDIAELLIPVIGENLTNDDLHVGSG